MEDFHRQRQGGTRKLQSLFQAKSPSFGGRMVVPHADDLMPIREFQISWLKVTFLKLSFSLPVWGQGPF